MAQMAARRSVQVSWVYNREDEPVARELLRLASVLEKLGLVRNQVITADSGSFPGISGSPPAGESYPTGQHSFGGGIAVFLVSSAALGDEGWVRMLRDASRDRRAGTLRTLLVLVRSVAMSDLPAEAHHLVVLPKDGSPIATRRDREDAMLEVIQAVQEMAALQPTAVPRSSQRERSRGDLSINDIFRITVRRP